MKSVRIKKLELENFKCFKKQEVEFAENTLIMGCNGSGKSTLYDAVLWVLFDKLADGSSASGIRPHDENGKEIDNIDISVTVVFDVDGKEITLTKTQSQKWTKKRGSEAKSFEGNVNTFAVNGIPKSQKDYKNFIADNLCDEDTFLFCTNAQTFFSLDTKKRRAKLIELTNGVTDAEVIESDPDFLPLAEELETATTDELIKRSSVNIRHMNDSLKTIPARIDELDKSIVEVDTERLNELEEKQSEIDSQLEDLQKRKKGINRAYANYVTAQKELDNYKADTANDLADKRKELLEAITSAENSITDRTEKISDCDKHISDDRKMIADANEDIAGINALIADVKSMKFNPKSLICPSCGQEYPIEKQKAVKADFEAGKKSEIDKYNKEIAGLKERIKALKADQAKYAEQKQKLKTDVDYYKEIRKLRRADLKVVPAKPDYKDDVKYAELSKKLADTQAAIKGYDSISAEETELTNQKASVLAEISSINSVFEQNKALKKRINELSEEQRQMGQKIADEQAMADLLERFQKAKMEKLEENVNEHFSIVKWVLFAEQINGGYRDICKATVNGSDMEGNLNHGHRILGNIDILNSLQKINNVQLPIFIDDAESLDEWRMPKLDTQVIILRRTDDDVLTVKEG